MRPDVDSLDPDPYVQLAAWLAAAERAGQELANAFALATASGAGEPSVRMVLLRDAGERFGEDVPLPAFWGGYLLQPRAFEFWVSRADRLHDRVEYLPAGAGGWQKRRLQP